MKSRPLTIEELFPLRTVVNNTKVSTPPPVMKTGGVVTAATIIPMSADLQKSAVVKTPIVATNTGTTGKYFLWGGIIVVAFIGAYCLYNQFKKTKEEK